MKRAAQVMSGAPAMEELLLLALSFWQSFELLREKEKENKTTPRGERNKRWNELI